MPKHRRKRIQPANNDGIRQPVKVKNNKVKRVISARNRELQEMYTINIEMDQGWANLVDRSP
jgi:hypothetical protein